MSDPLPVTERFRAGEALMRLGIMVLRGLARLPYSWLVRVGNALGVLLYVLASPRRRIAQVNLALCFPERSEAERRQIARAHFQAFFHFVSMSDIRTLSVTRRSSFSSVSTAVAM